jgi:hypothetical protein
MPRMAFMGVRISWLMFARNWLLACDAASAASAARITSVMSKRKLTTWPSGIGRSTTRSVRPSGRRRSQSPLWRWLRTRLATHSSCRPCEPGGS